MAESAELLLIKDQYELAFHCLSQGLAAEEAGNRAEALELYKKGQQHLTQGLQVPTGDEKQQRATWDVARQLQQKMRETLRTTSTHIADLESAELPTEGQAGLYPALAPNMPPPHSTLHHLYPTLHHLYPTLPDNIQATLPVPLQPQPAPPPAPHTHRLPSEVTAPSRPPQPLLPLALAGDQPPAYTPQPTEDHHSLAYSPGTGGLGLEEKIEAAGEGDELLFIPSGVQLFFVTPEGEVSSLFSPGYLRIVAFNGQCKDSATGGRPSAFLQVCDWLYPLTSDTPVLLSNSGIFMFPDKVAESPGSYVGIVLSSELPAADWQMFQDLLSYLVDLRVQAAEGAESEVINLSEKVPLGPPREEVSNLCIEEDGLTMMAEKPPLPEWSEKMAHGILSGSTRLSHGFAKGADATSRAIHWSAAKLRDRITPESTPAEVNPRVTRGLHVAKQATGQVLSVSRFLVNGISTAAEWSAEKLVPHLKKHGPKLIPESMKKAKDGRPSNLEGAKKVAVTSIQSFSTIWTGLEKGAKHVSKSVTSETITTVTHKYGDEAGRATDTGFQSVINLGVAAYHFDNLGLKAILKQAGKKTAKAMVQKKNMENGQPAETEGKEMKKEEQEKK